ncbi:hypothetical protein MJD09_01255, partial [bacterium]|nr:hypothetical protein [bacterium]
MAVLSATYPILLFAQTPHSNGAVSPLEREHVFTVLPAQNVYNLLDSLIIPGSEKIWTDSTKLRQKEDYTVKYMQGAITLERALPAGTLIKARYQVWPFSLPRVHFRRQPVVQTTSERNPKTNGHQISPPARKVVAPSRPTFGANLRKSGSLIRGITVGSDQDLQVDSGLRMQISGRLAENVDVVASLTDRNTPLQPEGNTQTLQEIDKVFVQLTGPNFSATLGDYNFDLSGTEFTRYNRKLQGAMGTAEFQNTKVTVSGAVSRGRFKTSEFLGREGNQGPYQLTGDSGQINIIVLAGTERVWLDGELMTRGENHDYVIEYGNGQITFTRNRLITSDSRITVDFQFSDESFQRNLWGVRGESKLLNDRLKIGTTFIRETDDKDNLLSGRELSVESTQALSAAGDSVAVVPGWTFVGQDSGSYVQEPTGIFVFVGNNKGDHTVSFSFFGSGDGGYRNVGLGRYEYVGENLGSYRPYIILPQARRHDVVGFNLDLTPHTSLTLSSEMAISQFDRNLFSSAGDGDNAGTAYSFNLN